MITVGVRTATDPGPIKIYYSFFGGQRAMTGYGQSPDYGNPMHGGPDRLLMFLILALIGMVLLRAFWVFH